MSSIQSGLSLSHYRAGKIMNILGLSSCWLGKHTYRKTTQEHINQPNALARQFAVTEPDQVWCGNITYFWTGELYEQMSVRTNQLIEQSDIGRPGHVAGTR